MNNSTSEVHYSPSANLLYASIRHDSHELLQGLTFDRPKKRIEQINTFKDFTETYKASVVDYDSTQNIVLLPALGQTGANATNEHSDGIWSKNCPNRIFHFKGMLEFNASMQDREGYAINEISDLKTCSLTNCLNSINQTLTNTKSIFESFDHDADMISSWCQVQVHVRTSHYLYLVHSLQEEIWHNTKLDCFHEFKEKIIGFNSLSPNWDGDGAEKIPESAVETSLKFLDVVYQFLKGHEPTNVAPSPDGEIVFYWDYDNDYAEVNFDGAGTVTLCWKEEIEEIQLIEEDVEIIFDVDWIEKSLVWKKLYSFLCCES